jgi:hypothetical protein
MAARINVADAVISVMGSLGETWTSSDFKTRLTAKEATSPIARPIPAGSIPCRNTSPRISRGYAEGHPDSDLLRAAAYEMRDDGIQADRCQQKRNRGK